MHAYVVSYILTSHPISLSPSWFVLIGFLYYPFHVTIACLLLPASPSFLKASFSLSRFPSVLLISASIHSHLKHIREHQVLTSVRKREQPVVSFWARITTLSMISISIHPTANFIFLYSWVRSHHLYVPCFLYPSSHPDVSDLGWFHFLLLGRG